MELDDFKQDWKKSGEQFQTPEYNLNDLLISQSSGPLSALKKKYKNQVILLPLAAGLLGFIVAQKPILQQSAFIWFIIPVLLLLALMYYRDYRLVVNMEQTTTKSLKSSLQVNITLLNRNAKQQLHFTRIILVVFILILEATMYYQHTADFNFWQEVLLPIRLVFYSLMLFIQPYVTTYFFNLSFGNYITRLQQLLDQSA
jgi:ABC-type multidrug transport system fused ATPase/permease subunit